jgi:CheY-like chemotaxis protein
MNTPAAPKAPVPPTPPTAPKSQAEVAEALRVMREKYRASVANVVAAFRYLAAQLTVAPDKPEVLESVRRELHRVHGTAGSFGFPEASRLAGVLEARAVRWASDPAFDRGTRGAIIAHFASALEAHVCGIPAPPAPPQVQPSATPPAAPPPPDSAGAREAGGRTADSNLREAPKRQQEHPEGVSPQSAARSPVPDVVVVEDDPSLAEMVRYALQTTGYTCRHFAAGPDALEALLALETGTRRPVVLLDVDLPGLDGFSLYERLRTARPDTFAVVFFTSHAAEAEQLRAYRAGALDYVTKPVNMRILLAKIPTWLGRAAGGTA